MVKIDDKLIYAVGENICRKSVSFRFH